MSGLEKLTSCTIIVLGPLLDQDSDARPSFAWLGAKLEQIMPMVALPRYRSTKLGAGNDDDEENFGFEAPGDVFASVPTPALFQLTSSCGDLTAPAPPWCFGLRRKALSHTSALLLS